MERATLPEADVAEPVAQAPDIYARAIWARLAMGAFLAGLSAWAVAMIPPLRASLLIEHGAAAIGLTLWGVTLAALPVLIWACARVLARGPNLLNPLWYWFFVVAIGASANTLALLILRDSVVPVFALTALGFALIHLAHRLTQTIAPWVSAFVFAAAGAGGEYLINAVLKGSWPFTALDLTAIGLVALFVVPRSEAFARIRALLKRPHPKAGVTFAAMHVIGLANAPRTPAIIEEGARS